MTKHPACRAWPSVLLAALALAPAVRAEALLNGRDLSGWECVDGDTTSWAVGNGEIVSRGASTGGWLVTEAEFGSFALHLEFQLSQVGNSGVSIRAGRPNSVFTEVQLLAPWTPTRDDLHCTASLYGLVAVRNRPDETPLTWRSLDVVCQGRLIRTFVDGKLVTEADTATVPEMAQGSLVGTIGLQSSHSGPDEWVRFRDLRIECLDRDPEWVAELLGSDDAALRAEGLRCARLCGAGLVPHALDLCAAPELPKQKIGEEALSRIVTAATAPGREQEEEAVEAALLRCIDEPRPAGTKALAIRSLGLVSCEAAVPTLSGCLATDQWKPAQWALERTPCRAATEALLAAGSSTELPVEVRVGAVHALGARGDRTAVPGLRTLLACGEPAVVEAAVDTLGILADPSAAAELVSLMRGDGEGLRRAAVGAVLRMADALIATDPALARILFERARHAARTEGHANAARAGLGRLDPER